MILFQSEAVANPLRLKQDIISGKESVNCMAGKVKIRGVSRVSLIITIILSLLCVSISMYGLKKYNILRTAMDEYVACEEAIHDFDRGSDILTRKARLAAYTGETKYIDGYFQEVNYDRHREKAIEKISDYKDTEDAAKLLEEAMDNSKKLMETEYYAMRLVEETTGTDYASWPNELQMIELSEEDEALSDKEKLTLARDLMGSPEYELTKNKIMEGANKTLEEISNGIGNRQNRAADIFSDIFKKILLCMAILALLLFAIYLIMRHWIVKPLTRYNESIKQGQIFPVCGAYELQVLAKSYNEVYMENEEREKLMKHQAEHDPMTGALNRRAFDQILKLMEKDKRDFALILVDVDTFKSVNDTYGHAVGDIILKRVASLLKEGFRSIDHICRIGGDEFAVIMMDVTGDLGYTIEDKIQEINKQLEIHEENIPAVSLSVGVAFTDRENPGESLFEDADLALYYVKEHGRKACRIYSAEDAKHNEEEALEHEI